MDQKQNNNNQLQGLISPSILSFDFSCLYDECKKFLDLGADQLHIDVMDGHFVPNLTFGPPVIKCLKNKLPNVFFDCHCMLKEPYKWVNDFAKCGADQFTFHIEAEHGGSIQDLVKNIKSLKMKAGLAINPKTEITDEIINLLNQNLFDTVLIMTVEPGFGGQKFMEDKLEKVRKLRKMYPNLNIGIDGGIDSGNIEIVSQAGANNIVSGTGIYKHPNPKDAMKFMKDFVEKNVIQKQQ